MRFPSYVIVLLFISAIVFANLSVAWLGVSALPYTAFLMIPFDLVTRDVLHDRWHGKGLWLRMGALILGGGLLSAAVSGAATRVALASMTAFVFAGVIDCYVYSIPRFRKGMRMALSNLAGAFADSAIFPAVALGLLDAQLITRQASIKFAGSLLWLVILAPFILKPTNQPTHNQPS